MSGLRVALFRPQDGTGQALSLTTATAASFSAVGKQTYAVALAVSPAATPYIAFARISKAGSNAGAGTDFPISSNNPQPVILAIAPGEIVSMYQASGSGQTGYLCELTH